MYYLNKIIGWALSPLGLLFLGLGFAWALRLLSRLFRSSDQKVEVDETGHFNARPVGMTKGERRCLTASRWVIGLTVGFMWIMSCGVTVRLIGVPLERDEVALDATQNAGEFDAVVLLGGGLGEHMKCGRAEMFSGADRAWEAVRQWKAHNDGNLKMTLSGGGVKTSTVPFLKDLGVDESALLFFPEARNTEEEAKLIAERLAGSREEGVGSRDEGVGCRGKPRILLVTSAWHMPRARMLFERQGLDVVEAPTDYEMHYCAEQPLKVRDFFPSAEALERNSAAVKEWVARFCYWLKG